MKKNLGVVTLVTILTLSMSPIGVGQSQAVPLDCEEFLNGGGGGLDCIDAVIFMHNGVAGPWDGDLEGDGWW